MKKKGIEIREGLGEEHWLEITTESGSHWSFQIIGDQSQAFQSVIGKTFIEKGKED